MPLEDLFLELGQQITRMWPQIVAATLVLVVGWTIGRIVGKAFSKTFTKTGLSKAVDRTAVGRALEKSGTSSVIFFDQLIRWSIYSMTILAAVDLLRIEAASTITQKVFEYIPYLVGGMLVLFAGLVVSDFIGNAVKALAIGMEFAVVLANMVKLVSYFVVVVTALSILQIDVSLLMTFGNAMAWGVAIAFGIAFGLGFKDYVARNAEKWVASEMANGQKEGSADQKDTD